MTEIRNVHLLKHTTLTCGCPTLMRKTIILTRLVFLLSITLTVELIGLPQPVTGPFVNFMLILTTLIISTGGGLVLGCITPAMAVLRGQLPAPLATMVPLIIIANLLFVTSFALLRSNQLKPAYRFYLRNGLAVSAAAIVKFAVLYLAAQFFLPFILGKTLPAGLVSLMALPQLITALVGGWFALFFYQMWQKKYLKNRHS
jgi:hypothetical protein